MAFFLFGKKKKRSTRKKKGLGRKPPAALLRKCRKLKIKTTMRKGRSRVYRKISVLKKLVAKKMRKHRKGRKARKSRRRVVRYRFGFGSRGSRFGADFSNAGPSNYGYNQSVVQTPGILSQSSQMVNSATNANRPSGLGLPGEFVPTYGVNRKFFTEDVPTQVGPNWNFMGQPDGTSYGVGGPFYRFTKPAAAGAFGRRTRRFGRGGCGTPLMKRDASGKCVYKKLKRKSKMFRGL